VRIGIGDDHIVAVVRDCVDIGTGLSGIVLVTPPACFDRFGRDGVSRS
jgi:hypothetical protein